MGAVVVTTCEIHIWLCSTNEDTIEFIFSSSNIWCTDIDYLVVTTTHDECRAIVMSSIEWEYSTTNGIHDTFEVRLEILGEVFEVISDVGTWWEVMMFPFDHCVDCGHREWGLECESWMTEFYFVELICDKPSWILIVFYEVCICEMIEDVICNLSYEPRVSTTERNE